HQKTLIVRSVLGTKFGGGFWISTVDITIYRVIDPRDGVLDVEDPHRAIAQVIGNGSDAVALINRISRDRQVRAIQANERYVGPVKGGHKRKPAPAGTIRKHLAGEQGAH